MTDDIIRKSKTPTCKRCFVIQEEDGKPEEETKSETYTLEEATNFLGVGLFQMKLIILSGFVWYSFFSCKAKMSRGFESILLRSVTAFQACTWNLQRWHGALLLTLTELITVLGCLLYGISSDKHGRRRALWSSLIFSFVFAAVSAGLPSYIWFVAFRAVVGFAVGGMPQTLVLCCEYMPSSQRGRCVYILSCFWALGVVIMISVLFLTLGKAANWRIFVAIGAFPAFLAMIMMRFFPESYRFLSVSNQYFAANEIIAEVADRNKKDLKGHLQVMDKQRRRGKVEDLFRYSYGRSTVLFWFLGMATAISFLGMTVITPFLLHRVKDGLVIYMILVDILDRKKLLCGSYFLSALFIFLLLIPTKNSALFAAFIYGARMFLVSQFDLLLLTIAETYPTTHRGTAVGTEAAVFYLGQFVSTYIAQALLAQNFRAPIILYGIVTLICGIASILLKFEPKGKELKDSMEE